MSPAHGLKATEDKERLVGLRQQELAAVLAKELTAMGKDTNSANPPVVTGPDSVVFDLTAQELPSPAGGPVRVRGATLRWTEQLPGDFDQNGIVNFADVTALAQHFGELVEYLPPTDAGGRTNHPAGDPDGNGAHNWRLARIDGDHNGLINAADLIAIAEHYHESIDNYWVYWRRADQLHWGNWHFAATLQRSVAIDHPARCSLELIDPADGATFQPDDRVEFLVKPSGKYSGELGAPSQPAAVVLNSQQWETGPRAGLAEAMAADRDGNIYAVGSVTDTSATGYRHLLLSKTREPGLPQWQKHYGGHDACIGHAIAVDSDGNVVICGAMSNDGAPNSNTLLLKATPAGDLLFQRRLQFAENCQTKLAAVAIASDNSIYTAGLFHGYDLQTHQVYDALLLLHFDVKGTLLWNRVYRAASNFGSPQLVVDANSLFVAAGGVICLDSAGQVVWSEDFLNARASYLAPSEGGQMWISGSTDSAAPDTTSLWYATLSAQDGSVRHQTTVQVPTTYCFGGAIQRMPAGDVWSGGMASDGYQYHPYLVHLDTQSQYLSSFTRGLGNRLSSTLSILAVQQELIISAPFRQPGRWDEGDQPVWEWQQYEHAASSVVAEPLELHALTIVPVEKDPSFTLESVATDLTAPSSTSDCSTVARVF